MGLGPSVCYATAPIPPEERPYGSSASARRARRSFAWARISAWPVVCGEARGGAEPALRVRTTTFDLGAASGAEVEIGRLRGHARAFRGLAGKGEHPRHPQVILGVAAQIGAGPKRRQGAVGPVVEQVAGGRSAPADRPAAPGSAPDPSAASARSTPAWSARSAAIRPLRNHARLATGSPAPAASAIAWSAMASAPARSPIS